MTLVKQNNVATFLVSGSDHVDNSIIVWNLQTFTQAATLNGHSAAVVALLSLDDGSTVVSASYDKTMVVWSLEGQPLQKLTSAHSNAVTCLAMAQDRQHFVSGGLDSLINVWRVKYKANGVFESTYLERNIRN
jgi:F-box/WD-40 domain protein 7